MKAVCRFALAAVVCAVTAQAVSAQQPAPVKDPQATAPKPEQKPAPKPDQPPDQPKYEETVVVSASRSEEKLINAPATMTVIGSETIQSSPTQNFAELMRTVPVATFEAGSFTAADGTTTLREINKVTFVE